MDLIATLQKGVSSATWRATLEYYATRWLYVLFLFGTVEAYKLGCKNLEVVALNAVISYAMFILIMIFLQMYKPDYYISLKIWCAPGHDFLKFWISFNFFAFLVQIPSTLIHFSTIDCISWFIQTSIMALFPLIIIAYVSMSMLWVFKTFLGIKDQKELNVTVVIPRKTITDRKSIVDINTGANKPTSRRSSYSNKSRMSLYKSRLSNGADALHSESHVNKSGEVEFDVVETANVIDVVQFKTADEVPGELSNLTNLTGEALQSTEKNFIDASLPRLSTAQVLSIGKELKSLVVEEDLLDNELKSDDEQLKMNINPLQVDSGGNKLQVDSSADKLSALTPVIASPPTPPLLLTITDLWQIWLCLSILAFIIRFSYGYIAPHSAIVFCQFSTSYLSFVGALRIRALYIEKHSNMFVKSFFQVPILFFPAATILAMCSSNGGFINPYPGLASYITELPITNLSNWGGGDFATVFLPAAIISLAWNTIDAIMKFSNLMGLLIPMLVICCFLAVLLCSLMSDIFGTPATVKAGLLTRSITTPVAVNLSALTHGPVALIAASCVVNSVFLARVIIPVYRWCKVDSPIVRGLAGAVVGTLLVPLALEENGEILAAGIGMACYGIGTVIYAVLLAIGPILKFLLKA